MDKTRKNTSVTILLVLTLIIFFTTPLTNNYAQEAAGVGGISVEKIKEKIGSSDSGALSLGSEAQKYYKYLGDSQKQQLLEGLSSEDKTRIYESLSEYDRQDLFKLLTITEKRNLFKSLSDPDKKKVFKSLNDIDRTNLFKIIDDSDKQIILNDLSHPEKSRLIESLPEGERRKWLSEYPELELVGTTKSILSEKSPGAIEQEGPPLSDIEKILSGQFPTDISRTLRQFGYDYFERESSGFTPETLVPVGPDYIIGPEDYFTIHLWGRAEETYHVVVSRDGGITVPRLGTLNVGGLSLSELKLYLLHKFKEYYPDFEMSVTMGALRTIEVFLIGELENPGTYSLKSLSTVISALFTARGPSKTGSLRNIKVFSNGELVKALDLYDFFIKGTKGSDIRLQQGYTIFVPVLGPVVGIAGHVKRPAIYEMKGEQTIGEVIDLAGGVLFTGHLQNVVIERILGHRTRVINSFNLDPSSEKSNRNLKTPVQDGDVIKIYPVHKSLEKVVYLEGHTKYPREYELKQGMRLLDIIPSYDYLLPEPYLPQAEIIRLMPPDLHPEIVQFNLGSLLNGDKEQNFLLQDRDRIRVYSAREKSETPEVTINGAVRNPGVYRLYKGMTVKDLIFQAGNIVREAYMEKAGLTRMVSGTTGMDVVKLSFSLQRVLEGVPEDNLLLKEDDQVFIREIPKYKKSLERKIILEGEFVFPGEYTFSEGERILSVIDRAGGLTETAYPFGSVFLRESVKDIQKERKLEYLNKLEQDILTMSALAAESTLDAGQASVLQQTLTAKKELIEKLKSAEPTGRMVINISEVMLMPSSDTNIELRPGDRLIIGERPDSINILGEVYNPTALLAEKERTVGYYLSLVGGPTENADKGQIYIVKADGSVISKKQGKFGLVSWSNKESRWRVGSFNSIELDPGDTIIVPKKLLKFAWLRLTKDISQVLYQIAVTAGVLHTSFGLF
ncbi:SLBB domain-containing protein [Thermodesulfobacteriota bacterium]